MADFVPRTVSTTRRMSKCLDRQVARPHHLRRPRRANPRPEGIHGAVALVTPQPTSGALSSGAARHAGYTCAASIPSLRDVCRESRPPQAEGLLHFGVGWAMARATSGGVAATASGAGAGAATTLVAAASVVVRRPATLNRRCDRDHGSVPEHCRALSVDHARPACDRAGRRRVAHQRLTVGRIASVRLWRANGGVEVFTLASDRPRNASSGDRTARARSGWLPVVSRRGRGRRLGEGTAAPEFPSS